MGTCNQEGKPCSEYPLWIFPQSVNRISNEYPRAIPWISDEPEIEYWSFPSSVQCTTVLLLHGGAPTVLVELSSDQNIEIWERAIRGCPSIVSGVCLKCPRIILTAQSCSNHVYKCVAIGEQSTKFNRLFKFNHVYKTVCHLHTAHTLSRAFFVRLDFVPLKHCIFTLQKCCEGICRCTAWRTLDVWTTKPIAFNVRPDKIHRRSY